MEENRVRELVDQLVEVYNCEYVDGLERFVERHKGDSEIYAFLGRARGYINRQNGKMSTRLLSIRGEGVVEAILEAAQATQLTA